MNLFFPTLQDLEQHHLTLPRKDEIHIFFIPAEDIGKMHKKGTSRQLVKQISSSYLCLAEEEIVIREGTHGKPYLVLSDTSCSGRNLSFNLSHTTGYMVIAFATDMDLGIDIERGDRAVRLETISRHFFHEKEKKDLSESSSGGNKSKHFVRIWTLKEAFLKGLGVGLTVSPSSFMLISDGDKYKISCDDPTLQAEYSKWILQDIPGPDDYFCSLAYRKTERIPGTEEHIL